MADEPCLRCTCALSLDRFMDLLKDLLFVYTEHARTGRLTFTPSEIREKMEAASETLEDVGKFCGVDISQSEYFMDSALEHYERGLMTGDIHNFPEAAEIASETELTILRTMLACMDEEKKQFPDIRPMTSGRKESTAAQARSIKMLRAGLEDPAIDIPKYYDDAQRLIDELDIKQREQRRQYSQYDLLPKVSRKCDICGAEIKYMYLVTSDGKHICEKHIDGVSPKTGDYLVVGSRRIKITPMTEALWTSKKSFSR